MDSCSGVPRMVLAGPRHSAEALSRELRGHGLTSRVNAGFGLAVVMLRTGLNVWTDGVTYWWLCTRESRHERPTWAWQAAADHERAAVRLARQSTTTPGISSASETIKART